MAEDADNKVAREAQEAEMRKIGIKPHSERGGKNTKDDSDLEEENEDMGELDENDSDDEDSDEEEEDSEDDSEDEDDESEDEDEDDEEDDHKKKGVEFKTFNKVRSDLRKANAKIAELSKSNEEMASKLPDDFEKKVDDLAKEIGVEDPEGLKKITKFMKDVISGEVSNIKKEFQALKDSLEEVKAEAPIKDNFSKEWNTFVKDDFKKSFPNATPEEVFEAEKLMNRLSHTKDIGGKAFMKDGKEMLQPYELDYIFYKNKDKFEELVTGTKSKGMERNRTQGIDRGNKGDGDNKPLKQNASAKDIREYEKRSAQIMTDGPDNLSAPIDDSL